MQPSQTQIENTKVHSVQKNLTISTNYNFYSLFITDKHNTSIPPKNILALSLFYVLIFRMHVYHIVFFLCIPTYLYVLTIRQNKSSKKNKEIKNKRKEKKETIQADSYYIA